jgi:diaminohydroxyphosphoribosylaminopyrimidine deaminase/5-amino-6-(5-phosphoribosylamino)uracil reductase
VRFSDASAAAVRVSDPFVKRVTTGLPWVIAKWAQTIDGKVATRTGESQWISCATSRRQVHRLRGRVDVVLTGIGTVLADDPMLTVRGVRARRPPPLPRRVVVDGRLETPAGSKLAASAREAPVMVLCSREAYEAEAGRRQALEETGVEIVAVAGEHGGERIDLAAALRLLRERFDATNVLVEAGPGLLGSLFESDLVDACVVYIAPMVMGDEAGLAAVGGRVAERLSDGRRFELAHAGRAGADVTLRYRRPV